MFSVLSVSSSVVDVSSADEADSRPVIGVLSAASAVLAAFSCARLSGTLSLLGSHHGRISDGCLRSHPNVALILDANDDSAGGLPQALSLAARLLAVSDSAEEESVDVLDARVILRAEVFRDGM